MPSSLSNFTSRNIANRVSMVLLAVIATLVGYQSFAHRPEAGAVSAVQAQATGIATFDLEKTFEALEEWKAGIGQLQTIANGLNSVTDEMAKQLKTMNEELEDLQPGAPKHKETMDKIVQATNDYSAQVEFNRFKIDTERARVVRRVYNSIRKEAEKLATERGYAVVFVDDSVSPIPPGSEEEMMRQITARRMVYTSPEVDVTDELISRMNSAWKNVGPAPAPGASKP
jgi:Skp family chaperone for outer membrane proteins